MLFDIAEAWEVKPRVALLGAVAVLVVFHLVRSWLRLRHIPGPFLASLTNFQRAWWVATKEGHLYHQKAYEKYGEVVRIGPNMVMVTNPEAIPVLYPMRPGFIKSPFYACLRPYTTGKGALQAVFNTQDEALHKLIKSPIAPIFNLSSVATFENLVEDVLHCLHEKLEDLFDGDQVKFNLGNYVQYFAFDVMGTMTFSKKYGFLDKAEDINGMLDAIFSFQATKAPLTQIPWLDRLRYRNAIAHAISPPPGLQILQFVRTTIDERQQRVAEGKPIEQHEGRDDFLARYMRIMATNEKLPPWAITAWVFSNVIAGSDSVGTVMRTTLFQLLTHPETLEKLTAELMGANLTKPYPKYAEVRDLPYLDACVQEGSRMHPPFCLPFERIVPEGGITVLGHYIPEGTVIGGSPYVNNRHKPTWGDDAEEWNPDRWLRGGPEHKKKLEQSNLTFGAGRRVCLGRHVGILEIKKCIPFLIMNYDLSIVDPKTFKVENLWFFKQTGLETYMKRRDVIAS